MNTQGYVAFDLGAESGRAMLAFIDEQKVELEEVHRFANVPQRLPSGYHWNVQDLWNQLVQGLAKCGQRASQRGIKLMGVGVDTWGVDFGLLGKSGQLLGLPFSYRDERSGPAFENTLKELGAEKIFQVTGIQFLPFNTLYQLVAQRDSEPQMLTHVAHLLNMPDLMHYFLCGQTTNEATIASTTQMVDVHTGTWSNVLLDSLGLPTGMLGPIIPAGTKIGQLSPHVADAAGVKSIDVIVPGCHDTASAVVAVPVDMTGKAATPSWAYLSSGTWSILGAELDEPVLTEEARRLGFSNERGVENKIRLLKNISGLWLVQQCRRDLADHGESYDYCQLTQLAQTSPSMRTLIDPAHEPFAAPGAMLAKIEVFAKTTDQPVPETPGQFVRCCLESLALSYRQTLKSLEQLLEQPIEVLHIVGGGGKNMLLNQMTADAIGRPVIVGPLEATATGNALTQALGIGQIRDLAHLRQILRRSIDSVHVHPQDTSSFDDQVERFKRLTVISSCDQRLRPLDGGVDWNDCSSSIG